MLPTRQDIPASRSGYVMVAISVFRSTRYDEVACFFRRAGYRSTIGEADTILGARSEKGLVGLVRLSVEEFHLVLRGMQVETGSQRQGIGRLLLDAAVEEIGGRGAIAIYLFGGIEQGIWMIP